MSEVQKYLLAGILVAVVLGVGVYFFINKDLLGTILNPGTNTATTTVGGVTGTGSYTVESVGIEPPSLDRPISITTTTLTEDEKKILRNILERQVALLRKEPTRVDLWLQLGVNRKIGGDFDGAIEAWEYVAQVAPKDMSATAHGNLGDLYMYFLKDYAKADTRFNQAIVLNPAVIDYYRALFYLYRDIYKDKTKAQAILTLGLKNNPDNKDLLGLQAQIK